MRIEDLPQLIDEIKEAKIKVIPCHTNRASELGHPCIQYLVFNRIRWQDKLLHDINLQYIFDEGKEQEKIVLQTLIEAGFEITQQQRANFEILENISGHLDCFVSHPKYLPEPLPAEIKSLSQFNFDSINSYKDMIEHKRYYIRKYPAQLQLYLYMTEKEKGLFILKNKQSGKLKFIECNIDYNYIDILLKKAKKINEYCEKIKSNNKDLEIEKTDDISICEDCCFRHICITDKNFGEGINLLADEQIEELIKENLKIKNLIKEFEERDEQIKKFFKEKSELSGNDKNEFLLGNFIIKTNKVSRTNYNVPIEIKKQYEEKIYFWKTQYQKI